MGTDWNVIVNKNDATPPPDATEPPAASPDRIAAGSLVLLVTMDNKQFLLRVQPGKIQHTHRGKFQHTDLVGQSWGETVRSQIGHDALLLEPDVSDMMRHLKRSTQVIYPKDAAYLVHRLNLRAGSRVIEAGTGSGALTIALAWSVAPTGRIYTYEARADNYDVARGNLARFGLLPHVEMFQQSIENSFQQENVDALFLDVREPWQFLDHVHAALRPGGFFACLLPTTNQVSLLLDALENAPFTRMAVEELLLRRYKPVPDRLRPEDNMVGHTGYLTFARAMSGRIDPAHWLSQDRKRYRARRKAQAMIADEEERRAAERASGGPKYPRLPLPD